MAVAGYPGVGAGGDLEFDLVAEEGEVTGEGGGVGVEDGFEVDVGPAVGLDEDPRWGEVDFPEGFEYVGGGELRGSEVTLSEAWGGPVAGAAVYRTALMRL